MPNKTMPDTTARHEKYEHLIKAAQGVPATTISVAHPCDEVSLESAVEAARLGIVKPVLVGPAGAAGHRPSRQRCQPLRGEGRPQRRKHDGLHGS